MSIPMNAAAVLDREFLEIRAKILELAAFCDRLDRAAGSLANDPRLLQIHQALGIVQDQNPDRAEQIQMLFSLPYDDDWQEQSDVAPAE